MDDSPLQQLSNARIGEPMKLRLSEREENRAFGIALVQQASHSLDIVSRELDATLFDNDEFVGAVKDLATSTRKARIRILVQNTDRMVKHGHRLIELARRLTSFIEIRIQGKDYRDFNEAWLIVDNTAWIRRPVADRYEAEIDCSAKRILQESDKAFTAMWEAALPDPNLRRLHI